MAETLLRAPLIEMPSEPGVEYRAIDGWPHYLVGDDGSVWSRKGYGRSKTLSDKYKKMSGCVRPDGYITITLRERGRKSQWLLHSLVLTVFKGPRPRLLEGCHDNGVKSDCRLSNLYWGTPKRNGEDRVRHGSQVRGEKHGKAKLTTKDILAIRASDKRNTELAVEYRVSSPHISFIRSGRFWKHVAGQGGANA
jgi:hypothetical protein